MGRGNGYFIKYDKQLLYAKSCVGRDGKDIPLSHIDKAIYLYLKDRVNFFKSRGLECFESHELICDRLNISKRTMSSWLKKMVENGIVECHKTRTRNGTGYKYTNVYNMKFREDKVCLDDIPPAF